MARLIASAMASDFQYERKAAPAASGSAMATPMKPPPSTRSNAPTTSATKRTNPAIRRNERRLLEVTWSYTGYRDQNWTWTGPRDSSSASKYSRSTNPMRLAMITAGNDWILVLYLLTTSLKNCRA